MIGLNNNRRVSFALAENRACIKLANAGFSIKTIANATGLSPSQVIYRCGKKSIHISDYRNGKGTRAMVILSKYKLLSETGS